LSEFIELSSLLQDNNVIKRREKISLFFITYHLIN